MNNYIDPPNKWFIIFPPVEKKCSGRRNYYDYAFSTDCGAHQLCALFVTPLIDFSLRLNVFRNIQTSRSELFGSPDKNYTV